MVADCDSSAPVRYLGDLQRLELKPGDLLVLRLRDSWSHNEAMLKNLKETIEREVPGHKALVICGDADLAVIGKAESDGG